MRAPSSTCKAWSAVKSGAASVGAEDMTTPDSSSVQLRREAKPSTPPLSWYLRDFPHTAVTPVGGCQLMPHRFPECHHPAVLWPERFRGGCAFGADNRLNCRTLPLGSFDGFEICLPIFPLSTKLTCKAAKDSGQVCSSGAAFARRVARACRETNQSRLAPYNHDPHLCAAVARSTGRSRGRKVLALRPARWRLQSYKT